MNGNFQPSVDENKIEQCCGAFASLVVKNVVRTDILACQPPFRLVLFSSTENKFCVFKGLAMPKTSENTILHMHNKLHAIIR